MSDPYAALEEMAGALASVRKQLSLVVWMFSVVVVTIVAGMGGLFYVARDLPKPSPAPNGDMRSFEKEAADVKSNIRQMGAALQAELTGLGRKLEKVEQDLARLQVRPAVVGNEGDAAAMRAEPKVGPGGQSRSDPAAVPQETASIPQGNAESSGMRSLPLPRPRRGPQQPAAPRLAGAPSAPENAGPVELKVGSQISPAQFGLQPIPDELENQIPRLKGKMFFRQGDQIFVVDPKDNRIVELLR